MNYAIGVPNVRDYGWPRLLLELAVQAEEAGWDGFFVWDHLVYHDRDDSVADPWISVAAIATAANLDRRPLAEQATVSACGTLRRCLPNSSRRRPRPDDDAGAAGGNHRLHASAPRTIRPVRHRHGGLSPPDHSEAEAVVAPYAELGLTWWIEKLGWFRGSVAEMRERIVAGPPRSDL